MRMNSETQVKFPGAMLDLDGHLFGEDEKGYKLYRIYFLGVPTDRRQGRAIPWVRFPAIMLPNSISSSVLSEI